MRRSTTLEPNKSHCEWQTVNGYALHLRMPHYNYLHIFQ